MTTHQSQSVPAIWEDGVLRPLQPLTLPEHARVHITIAIVDNVLTPDREQIRVALEAAGLSLVEQGAHPQEALSSEARGSLAREVPPGRPLSQIIIEDRDGR